MNFQQRKREPMSAAERQRICRAKKKGTYQSGGIEVGSIPGHLLPNTPEHDAATRTLYESKGLAHLLQPADPAALPAPQTTAIEKTSSSRDTASSASGNKNPVDAYLNSLPPAVARRLKSLIDQHQSGKQLSNDELSEARELIDIAEYFILQRMRKQLAA